MAKFGSPSFKIFLVDGFNLLSAKIKNVGRKVENLLEPSHGLGDEWTETTPVGLRTATLTQDGAFFDSEGNSIHQAMYAQAGATRVVCVGEEGNTIGAHFTGYEGAVTVGYEAAPPLGGLVKANAMYQISGAAEEGQIVQHRVSKTVDWDTKATSVDYLADPLQRVVPVVSSSVANPSVITTSADHGFVTGQSVYLAGHAGSTPVINGVHTSVTVTGARTFTIPVNVTVGGTGGTLLASNTTDGGVGYQQTTDLLTFTGFIGKIMHSPDDVTYADLITFANVTTARSAERALAAGTIDRYTAYDGNVTGAGSLIPFAGLHRN